MIELNGELIMPTQVAASSAEANDKNRRVELGSVVFDTDVSFRFRALKSSAYGSIFLLVHLFLSKCRLSS